MLTSLSLMQLTGLLLYLAILINLHQCLVASFLSGRGRISTKSPDVCKHDFRLTLLPNSTREFIYVVWKPPPPDSTCRELEITLKSPLTSFLRNLVHKRQSTVTAAASSESVKFRRVFVQNFVSCQQSNFVVRELAFVDKTVYSTTSSAVPGYLESSVVYQLQLLPMSEPTGYYCNTSSTLEFVIPNNRTQYPLQLVYPRWTLTDAFLFLLVVSIWAVAVGLFTHKWRTLRIIRNSSDLIKKSRPKNIEQINVCHDINDTVIYKTYPRGTRMSICIEERQQRIANLHKLYSEMGSSMDDEVNFCGLGASTSGEEKIPPPLERHHTLGAIGVVGSQAAAAMVPRSVNSETDISHAHLSSLFPNNNLVEIKVEPCSPPLPEAASEASSSVASSSTARYKRATRMMSMSEGDLHLISNSGSTENTSKKTLAPRFSLIKRLSQAVFGSEWPLAKKCDSLPSYV